MVMTGNPANTQAGAIAMTATVTIQLRRSLLCLPSQRLCRNRHRGERAGSGHAQGAARTASERTSPACRATAYERASTRLAHPASSRGAR